MEAGQPTFYVWQQLLLVEAARNAGWQQGWAKECKVAVDAERM